MSKCLRCGAGSEWLQGSMPKEDDSYLESLRARLDEAEKVMEKVDLLSYDDTQSFIDAKMWLVDYRAKYPLAKKEESL